MRMTHPKALPETKTNKYCFPYLQLTIKRVGNYVLDMQHIEAEKGIYDRLQYADVYVRCVLICLDCPLFNLHLN